MKPEEEIGVRELEIRDALEYEHETITHNLMMEDHTLGKTAAALRAMTLILRAERKHNYCEIK